MTLGELLADQARSLRENDATVGMDGSTGWSREGRPFAVVSADGSVAEFALDAAVADAASRTPDVTLSGRGPGWVAFRPAVLDDHASDRAVAWFASAHRRLERKN